MCFGKGCLKQLLYYLCSNAISYRIWHIWLHWTYTDTKRSCRVRSPSDFFPPQVIHSTFWTLCNRFGRSKVMPTKLTLILIVSFILNLLLGLTTFKYCHKHLLSHCNKQRKESDSWSHFVTVTTDPPLMAHLKHYETYQMRKLSLVKRPYGNCGNLRAHLS